MEIATSLNWRTSLLIATGFTASTAIAISIWLIFKHLLHLEKPVIQKHIIRIIIMIPIYCVDSWLSIMWSEYALYFNVARDMYEAYVLFEFFKYLTDCVDGEENFAEKLEYIPQIRYSLPFCCFHIKPGAIFLHRCKQLILQYVFVKIGITVSTFIMEFVGVYNEGSFSPTSGYLYITIIYNLSIFVALYFLVLFYEGSKEILAPFQPLSKFLCIKAVIFFAFWQSVLIAVMVEFNFLITARPGYSSGDISTLVQNALICVEMFPIAVAFAMSFNWEPYKDPSRVPRPANPKMFISVLKNFGVVANVRDIVLDTKDSLAKEPARHVLTGDFFTVSVEEQKSRIVLEASIKKCGDDLAKIWKMRHVAIVSKPAGIMYWTKNPWMNPDKQPPVRGFVGMENIDSIVVKRDTAFNIVMKSTRVWRFRAASSGERDMWVDRIRSMLPKDDDDPANNLDGGFNVTEIDEDGTPSTQSPELDSDDEDEDENNETSLEIGSSSKNEELRPPPPRRPAEGLLSFLNRGVSKLTGSAPSPPPRGDKKHREDEDEDSFALDLSSQATSVNDKRQIHSDDEESINF